MISSLVYVSLRTPICTDAEIDKIVLSCKKNNVGLDITGVLLHSNTHFVQYIEGENKQIMGLYDRIKTDPRHKNVVLINLNMIESRLFPSWQMGVKAVNTDNVTFLTEISESEKLVFKDILDGKTLEGNKASELIKKFFK